MSYSLNSPAYIGIFRVRGYSVQRIKSFKGKSDGLYRGLL